MKISDTAFIVGLLSALAAFVSVLLLLFQLYIVAIMVMVAALVLYGVAEYIQERKTWGHPL